MGYCHFPIDYPEKYFLQLTAEKRTPIKKPNGSTVYEWKQIRPRNEALDCRVYAMAALYVLAGAVSDEVSPDAPIPWESFWTMLMAAAA
jgi:phage terminase large subunit GpA-like protein